MAGEGEDSLEGFRGRPTRDAYEAMEEEVGAYRSLATDDINLGLVQDILKSDNLMADLKDETSTLKRLVTYATIQIDEACILWFSCDDPASTEALNAHRNARAARVLLDWIQAQLSQGQQSEEMMQANDFIEEQESE